MASHFLRLLSPSRGASLLAHAAGAGVGSARVGLVRMLASKPRADRRVALVTGGSKGIGAGIVQELLKDNCHVLSIDVDPTPPANPVAGKGPELTAIVGDVANAEHCKSAVQQAIDTYGRLDILVNNAGIQPPPSCVPIHTLSDAHWHQVLAVNLNSIFYLSKAALPHMIAQAEAKKKRGEGKGRGGDPGVIINIASVQGVRSQKGVPVYAASKGAVLSLTRQMGIEYGEYGIRVLAVNPGTIMTPLVDGLVQGTKTEAQLGAPYPLEHRCGRPEEIGKVVVFLAGEGASFMTATDVNVDGGILAVGGWGT